MTPTSLTAALLGAIALSALVVAPAVALIAAALLAGATLADALAARAPVRAERRVKRSLARGVRAPIEIQIDAGAGRRVRFRQASAADLRVEGGEGDAEGITRASVLPTRRGRHLLPPLAVRVTGPLRLGSWTLEPVAAAEITVIPDLPAARRLVGRVRRGRTRGDGLRASGPLGLGTEFETVREYAPDDDVRQINWLATARLDRPMSNEFRLEQDRDVVALIDCGRLTRAPLGGAGVLDVCLDALAALAAVADELGDRFGAIAFDDEIRRALAPRRGGGARAVRALFDLEPSAADSDPARAFARVEAGKRALVVVFTDLLEPVAARPLIEAVPVLARRHALSVVAPSDPELERAVARPAAGPLGAYRSAAAVDVLRAREETALRLQRSGADVVSAPPGRLAAACVGSYLRAKRRALL